MTDPSGFSRSEAAKRRNAAETRNKATLEETKELIAEMDAAHDADHAIL